MLEHTVRSEGGQEVEPPRWSAGRTGPNRKEAGKECEKKRWKDG